MTSLVKPTLEFLTASLAAALLHDFGVSQAPVPIRQMVSKPPPDLTTDISLAESPHFTFCRAMWIRPLDGQGVIFLNAGLPENERRYELACALFAGLSASAGARAAGLYAAINGGSSSAQITHAQRFARWLLMPLEFLPPDWQHQTDEELARLFAIPLYIARARRAELLGLDPLA
jgi:hypothetical protein